MRKTMEKIMKTVMMNKIVMTMMMIRMVRMIVKISLISKKKNINNRWKD
jgi:hypothetical protein